MTVGVLQRLHDLGDSLSNVLTGFAEYGEGAQYFGAFGGVADDDHGAFYYGDFLLDSARVGDSQSAFGE